MALIQAHIKVTMDGGSVYEASGPWMTLADRVAFERVFKTTMGGLRKAWQDDNEAGMREEWTVFFAYRMLAREGQTVGEYGDFTENIAEAEVEFPDSTPNPTEPVPQPTS